MKVTDISIDLIKEYENNPRNNDEAVNEVAKSIKEFGFKVPIIIDKDNVIVTGHTRVKAARQLGLDKVPAIVADDLTPEQIKAFRLVDNKVAEYATWDFEKLDLELETLEFNIADFGFETKGIDEVTAFGDEEENDEPQNVGESNFNYHEQYGVIVMCKDEAEQEKIYNHLVDEGYECKVVAT